MANAKWKNVRNNISIWIQWNPPPKTAPTTRWSAHVATALAVQQRNNRKRWIHSKKIQTDAVVWNGSRRPWPWCSHAKRRKWTNANSWKPLCECKLRKIQWIRETITREMAHGMPWRRQRQKHRRRWQVNHRKMRQVHSDRMRRHFLSPPNLILTSDFSLVAATFDVYNIETALPVIDLEAIENHLKIAKAEERRVSIRMKMA